MLFGEFGVRIVVLGGAITAIVAGAGCRTISRGDEAPVSEETVYSTSAAASDDESVSTAWDRDLLGLASLRAEKRSQKCERAWSDVVADGKIKFYVVLGYDDNLIDTDVLVADSNFYDVIGYYLKQPCNGRTLTCGFTEDRSFKGHMVLQKQVPGPNGSRQVAVEIHIQHSSVSMYHDENIGKKKAKQDAQSKAAQAFFGEGIQSADIVIYNGHSRDGGGPDFFPPIGHGGHPNYAWYKAHRPGLNYLLDKLKGPATKVKLLGLFSCSSDPLFKRKILEVDRDLGFIGTHQTTEKRPIDEALMGAIDSVLNYRCQENFTKSMEVSDTQRFSISNFLE